MGEAPRAPVVGRTGRSAEDKKLAVDVNDRVASGQRLPSVTVVESSPTPPPAWAAPVRPAPARFGWADSPEARSKGMEVSFLYCGQPLCYPAHNVFAQP